MSLFPDSDFVIALLDETYVFQSVTVLRTGTAFQGSLMLHARGAVRGVWHGGPKELDATAPVPGVGEGATAAVAAESVGVRIARRRILQKDSVFLLVVGFFGCTGLSLLAGRRAIRPLALQLRVMATTLETYASSGVMATIPEITAAGEAAEVARALNLVAAEIAAKDRAIGEAESLRRSLLRALLSELAAPYEQAGERLRRLDGATHWTTAADTELAALLSLSAEEARLAALLLEYAGLSHRRGSFLPEPFCPAEVLSDVVGAVDRTDRHVSLSLEGGAAAAEVTGDPRGAARMVQVLLEAVIRRAPAGAVVPISTRFDSGSEPRVTVSVQSGAAIDALAEAVVAVYGERSEIQFVRTELDGRFSYSLLF